MNRWGLPSVESYGILQREEVDSSDGSKMTVREW